MNKSQYQDKIKELDSEIRYHEGCIRQRKAMMADLKQDYVEEALRESGYRVGEPFTDNEGVLWYVSGAYVDLYGEGNVYLTFNFAKKDGTMSKVSGLGRGMPYIKIRG